MGFHPANSINSLFYRTQWINLDRYGRSGNSPLIGLGYYPLKNWFHLSLPASYGYANAGAVTTLVATLVWVFGHLVWLESAGSWWWILSVVIVLFCSSTAYAMAFALQNYQMLGWMWWPMALYFSNESLYFFSVFTWFAAGLSGITPIFFALPIVLVIASLNQDPMLVLVILPALIHAATRFVPLLIDGGLGQAVINIAKLIGMTKRKVRYNRGMHEWSLSRVYFLILYLVSFGLISVSIGEVAILPLLGVILCLINERFIRVADSQSLIVIVASLFTFTVVNLEPSWLLLIALWLALNPIGYWLSIQRLSKDVIGDGKILINPPFDHTELEEEMNRFFERVSEGERIYFAFEDPGNNYSNIFDGYRVIYELPLQVASRKKVHLFPDWWAVSETNYEGAPQCWGRSLDEVLENCRKWNARYAIIYQESESFLEEKWDESFEFVSEFDWNDYRYLLRGEQLWPDSKSTPKWFLLRCLAVQ